MCRKIECEFNSILYLNMDEKLNHILSEKKCSYWNSDVFTKLFEDFKVNYDKKHLLYNQFIHILGNGKNYIEKVRIMIKHFIYIWSVNNSVISDKECNIIWKTYTTNFLDSDRLIIVEHIKNIIHVNIVVKSQPAKPQSYEKQKNLETELSEAQFKIEELTTKFSALMDVYNAETEDKKTLCEKYNKLEQDYYTLSSNYSQVYKVSEFREQRIEDLKELNSRLKITIDELRTSRDLYRDLYTNHGKY